MEYSLVRVFRSIPEWVRGKQRIARWILKNHCDAKDIVVQDNRGFYYQIPSLRETISFSLWVDGSYEPKLMKTIERMLDPGDCFVDIGANIGTFTIPASRWVGSNGVVVAAEASPSVLPYLRENVARNMVSNARIIPVAVAGQSLEKIDFYEAPKDKFGMGSLSPQFSAQAVSVLAKTLDQIIKEEGISHVHLIKIDVEGLEAEVFRGAKNILSQNPSPIIFFEFCDWAEARVSSLKVGEAQSILLDSGYQIWLLDDFIRKKPPLSQPLIKGFETLVAIRDPKNEN